ncbi:MAG TPA: O-antigen ligase family protein [Solirubrobacterales bacterium]|nr:O-antigen ligase family protein [Solirubrobacterales bacterium]
MAARRVWRPPLWAWGVLWLVVLAGIHKQAPARLEGHWMLVTPLVVAAGIVLLHELWERPPALTMCIAIALRVFSGAWSQMGIGGVPLDRVFIIVALAQILLRSPGAASMPRLKLRDVHLMMLLTLAYLVVSAAAAGTLSSAESIQAIVDEFGIAPYLGFLVGAAVFARRRERNWLLATLVGVGIYLGITAVFESLGPHQLVFPSYIANVDAADTLGRVNGPFQSSVAEGCAAFACAVAATIAFLQWKERVPRLFAAASILLCLFACFATLERGVWIATVAAVLTAALMSRRSRRLLLPGIAIALVAIGGLLAVSSTLAGKAESRAGDQRSIWDRKNQDAAGLRMVQARPLLGFGLGRYKTDSSGYFRQAQDYPLSGRLVTEVVGEPEVVLPLHNLYLAYAVELGLIGAGLWLVTLAWGVGSAIFSPGPSSLLPWKRGLAALAVFFIVVTFVNPKQPPFVPLLLWTWAGIALGAGVGDLSLEREYLWRRQKARDPRVAAVQPKAPPLTS